VFQSNLSAWAKGNASGIDPNFTWDNSILTGQASGTATNLFGGVIGPRTYTISVNSAATAATTPICVLGLNGQDNGAFDINGSKAVFDASCAVQANSNSKSGMSLEGNPTAKAKKFGVTGGHQGEGVSPPAAPLRRLGESCRSVRLDPIPQLRRLRQHQEANRRQQQHHALARHVLRRAAHWRQQPDREAAARRLCHVRRAVLGGGRRDHHRG